MAHQADRFALTWLLAASAWVIAPLTAHVPGWVSATVAALLAWSYLHAVRAWPLPGRILRFALAALLVVLIYQHHNTLFGRDAGVALLTVLAALKLLEARGQRDYVVSALLLFVLMGGVFLFGQDMWLVGYMLGGVILVTAALSSLNDPTGVSVAGRLKLAGAILLKALPITVLIYVAFPRLQGGLWLGAATGDAVTGMSDSLRPGSFGRVSESEAIAFRVEFDGAIPAPAQRYWRTLVLNRSDNTEWTRGPAVPDAPWRGTSTPVAYTVIAEPSDRPWLSALDLPAQAPAGARGMPGYLLEYREAIRSRLRYQAVSYPEYQTGPLDEAAREVALQLPRQSVRVQALAGHWRAQAAGDADAVRTVLAHFRNEGFVYSLTPPRLGPDPVDEFLFSTRTGYCEHYASTFVTLMRAMGIPARVVTGYQGGEVHPGGRYLIVREADAHAWAEVWLAGPGWLRVDPTAAVAPERVQYGADAVRRLAAQGLVPGRLDAPALLRAMELPWATRALRQARLWWDGVEMAWDRWVTSYTPERQSELLARLGLRHWPWSWIMIVLAGVVGLLLLMLALSARERAVHDPVQACYLRFCRKLAAVGLARAPHEGAAAFAARTGSARPDLADRIGAITQRYVDLRYGRLIGDNELDDLRRAVRAFRPPHLPMQKLEKMRASKSSGV